MLAMQVLVPVLLNAPRRTQEDVAGGPRATASSSVVRNLVFLQRTNEREKHRFEETQKQSKDTSNISDQHIKAKESILAKEYY